MKNNDRKFDILYSIIRDYIKTAEPVGSRTIERKYNIGISSATIRNEMADLEEMGYLVQPYTSAGRIPSDKAYRLYVDRFMKKVDVDSYIKEDVRSLYRHYFGELEEVMNKTAQILTKLTNLTSLVSTPNISGLNIKDIHLIHIEDERVLLVVITEQRIVKSAEIRLTGTPTDEMLEHVANFLNLSIKDMMTEFRASDFASRVDALTPGEQKIVSEVVNTIKVIFNSEEDSRVISNGVTEIFRYPEFRNDMDRTKSFLEAIHRQDLLSYLFSTVQDDSVSVRIGEENGMEELSNCSVISATYKINGRPVGTIGVVGPTRMDYDYCVSVIETLTNELTNHLDETIGGDKESDTSGR